VGFRSPRQRHSREEVVTYFKSQAGRRGYQTLINETLKASIRDRDLETVLRRVIREELHSTKGVPRN
jgi:hypothetical protein